MILNSTFLKRVDKLNFLGLGRIERKIKGTNDQMQVLGRDFSGNRLTLMKMTDIDKVICH